MFLTIFEVVSYYPIIIDFIIWPLLAVVIFKLGKIYAYGYGRHITGIIDSSDSDSESESEDNGKSYGKND
jgi:hypothetical protein